MNRMMIIAVIALSCSFTPLTWAADSVQPESLTTEASARINTVYPGLAFAGLTYAQLVELPEGVLVQSEDLKFTVDDLNLVIAKVPQAQQEQLAKNAFMVVEQEMTLRLLLKAARAALAATQPELMEKPEREIITAYLDSQTSFLSVTDADITTFYQENESMFCGTPLDKVKDQIGPFVLQNKKEQFVSEYLKTLGQQLPIQVSAAWAQTQAGLAKDNPLDKARGNGKITLAVFSAASCCGPDKMKPVLTALESKYDAEKLNIVYVEAKQEQFLATRYQVRSIPTQVFFDKTGQEIFRHVGFFATEEIEKQLLQIGI